MSKRTPYQTLALATGGLDSTTMLYQLSADAVRARVLYLDFGTPATDREKAAVKLFAHSLGFPLDIVDLSGLGSLQLGYLWPSMVSGPELDVGRRSSMAKFPIGRSDGHLTSGFGVIAATGLYAAALLDAESASLAIVRDQMERLPGLADGLRAATALTSAVNPDLTVDVVMPLAAHSKAEVVRRAVQLDVPIGMTWSCAYGEEQPCERCLGCLDRREAIAAAAPNIDAGPPAIDPVGIDDLSPNLDLD